MGHRTLQSGLHDGAPLPGLQAFTPFAQVAGSAGTSAALLMDELPEEMGLLAVDFLQAPGNGAVLLNGGEVLLPYLTGSGDVLAGYGGSGTGPGSASTGSARGAAHYAQLAGDSGLLAGMNGPSSGFSAGRAPADAFAIALGDAALSGQDIEQLPLLALAPTPADFDKGGQAGNGAGETANAVPEPATVFLLGLGLMGLLAMRLHQRMPAKPSLII